MGLRPRLRFAQSPPEYFGREEWQRRCLFLSHEVLRGELTEGQEGRRPSVAPVAGW